MTEVKATPSQWEEIERAHGAWLLLIISEIRMGWPDSAVIDMDNVNGEKKEYEEILGKPTGKFPPWHFN